MKKTTLCVFLLLTIILAVSCDTTQSDKIDITITLTEIDVGVSEAYLFIKNENPGYSKTLSVFRNGKEVFSMSGEVTDTSITDTNLAKTTTYSYNARLTEQKETVGKSKDLIITTLEPTSHEFEWEEHTFGDYQSFLYDVAIIEDAGGEHKIWAVGEIYLKDSEGNYDSEPYGLVRWDGSEWSIEKVQYYDFYSNYSIKGKVNTILSFTPNNTFLCASANLLQWDGEKLNEKAFFLETLPFTGQVSCMWGPDENNIYLGSGSDGSLYHYYGDGWGRLNTGNITGGITDIFGYKSSQDNEWKIFATVSFVAQPSDHKILKINEDNSIEEFPWLEDERVSCIWTRNGLPIYSAGDGVHIWRGESWDKIGGLPSKFAGHVSGTALNNIFVVGDFNMILHYNGETWNTIEDNKYGWYQTVVMEENTVVLVGTREGKAIIKIGRR